MKEKKSFLILPIILIIVYFCAGIFYDSNYVIYIKPFIIPSFLIYSISNNSKKLTFNYYLYVLFFYFSELLILFSEDSLYLYRAALIASFISYSALISLGYKYIKKTKTFKLPEGFELFIYALNMCFLIAIVYILMTSISDVYLNVILILNSLAALTLGITAVICLGKFTEQKMYYYFFGAFALIFNDVFAAIGTYYIQNSFLNALDRILHFTSFFLIYMFIITDKKQDEIELKIITN